MLLLRAFNSPLQHNGTFRKSKYMNLSQAAIDAVVNFICSMPYSTAPYSRMGAVGRVKSLSLETRQKPEKRPVYSKYMASMIMTPSTEFFRLVYASCWTGRVEWSSRHAFQLYNDGMAHSP
jgi:hypothetical protein